MLARMFAPDSILRVAHDKDGNVFIDRDGTHFRYILNFLRMLYQSQAGLSSAHPGAATAQYVRNSLSEQLWYNKDKLAIQNAIKSAMHQGWGNTSIACENYTFNQMRVICVIQMDWSWKRLAM